MEFNPQKGAITLMDKTRLSVEFRGETSTQGAPQCDILYPTFFNFYILKLPPSPKSLLSRANYCSILTFDQDIIKLGSKINCYLTIAAKTCEILDQVMH